MFEEAWPVRSLGAAHLIFYERVSTLRVMKHHDQATATMRELIAGTDQGQAARRIQFGTLMAPKPAGAPPRGY